MWEEEVEAVTMVEAVLVVAALLVADLHTVHLQAVFLVIFKVLTMATAVLRYLLHRAKQDMHS
jgi:hypothetical protein